MLRTKALIDSSMPMKNKSTTTPISASSATFSDVEITPMPVGPSSKAGKDEPHQRWLLEPHEAQAQKRRDRHRDRNPISASP
jgi:hypothetical protein